MKDNNARKEKYEAKVSFYIFVDAYSPEEAERAIRLSIERSGLETGDDIIVSELMAMDI
jgi:hypothetical protein